MEKKLICLEVPMIGESYAVLIPDFLTVEEVVPLLHEAVRTITKEYYAESDRELLCRRETMEILAAGRRLSDYNLENGDHLVLI